MRSYPSAVLLANPDRSQIYPEKESPATAEGCEIIRKLIICALKRKESKTCRDICMVHNDDVKGGLWKMTEIDRRVESVIGNSLTVKGEIQSSGTLRVYGVVEGSISSKGTVIVAEHGVVKADITAESIAVGGTIEGNLTARQKVELLSTGKLYGNVTTIPSGFIINEGSIFEGACKMAKSAGA